ncbi:hypothetical protein [Cupriavidus sp. AU9028]|uniref:hypothetical protein n=1 Tax=Cupriavidus sp. AU9028 TaxID=2871157 RepID=UPI001C94ED71|nr:hypothetical protein [Cupriavidus sp. AU9028]MBY4897283.1 hypothetical protein [Cupriavidus sp. AU9028]
MTNGNEADLGTVQRRLPLQDSAVTLPAELHVSEADVRDDVVSLVAEQIRDRQQFRMFRRVAFYGVWALIGLCFAALL